MADTSRVPLLSVEGLKKYYTAKSGMFSRSAGVVRAVDGGSFQLFEGETLGLVDVYKRQVFRGGNFGWTEISVPRWPDG